MDMDLEVGSFLAIMFSSLSDKLKSADGLSREQLRKFTS